MLCCSHMYAVGKNVWHKWKRRFFVLVQVSQYTFAMCSYREKKRDPTEMMRLDGFTVDYCEPIQRKSMEKSLLYGSLQMLLQSWKEAGTSSTSSKKVTKSFLQRTTKTNGRYGYKRCIAPLAKRISHKRRCNSSSNKTEYPIRRWPGCREVGRCFRL